MSTSAEKTKKLLEEIREMQKKIEAELKKPVKMHPGYGAKK